MTQVDTGNNRDGNTKSSRSRCWCFTWNNYKEEDTVYLAQELSDCVKFVFQEETGEQGTKHLQGYCEFANARSFDSMRKVLKGNHVEKVRNKQKAMAYCMKRETRTGRMWLKGIAAPVQRALRDEVMYDWQKEIWNKIKEEPDDRKVMWYWEKDGGKGKTTLARDICITYPDEAIYVGGRASDMKYAIAKMITEGKNLRIVIIDVCRAGGVDYEGIEAIKNGIFFTTKYESGMVVFNKPHVIVFSNNQPDRDALSADRWLVREIA